MNWNPDDKQLAFLVVQYLLAKRFILLSLLLLHNHVPQLQFDLVDLQLGFMSPVRGFSV